jgi:hypothetical protein
MVSLVRQGVMGTTYESPRPQAFPLGFSPSFRNNGVRRDESAIGAFGLRGDVKLTYSVENPIGQ